MKILVTGAGGFIGKNLVASLQVAGHEVLEYHHAAELEQLDVGGTVKKLLAIDYVRECLQGGEPA